MMKAGDLVGYNREKIPSSVPPSYVARVGVVIKVSLHPRGQLRRGSPQAGLPMATVLWNGITRPMKHRQDLLEVLSEAR